MITSHETAAPAANCQDLLLVQCSCADAGQAERIAQALIAQRLAACVLIEPVRSIYRWQGQIEQAQELRLAIKTTRAHWPAVERCILDLHSYSVPMILALPLAACHQPYADWLRAELAASPEAP